MRVYLPMAQNLNARKERLIYLSRFLMHYIKETCKQKSMTKKVRNNYLLVILQVKD